MGEYEKSEVRRLKIMGKSKLLSNKRIRL